MMRFVPVAGFLAFVLLLAVLLLGKTAPDQATGEARALPVLTLSPLDGNAVWKQESLVGRVTVLNFFASWCIPCATEMPELAALAKDFPAVHVEGVAWTDDAATLTPWFRKYGRPFRTVWTDKNGDATIALGIKGIPETLVIDAKGMVRYRLPAPLMADQRAEIDAVLRQLLAEARDAD